jgi:hypothetical protein
MLSGTPPIFNVSSDSPSVGLAMRPDNVAHAPIFGQTGRKEAASRIVMKQVYTIVYDYYWGPGLSVFSSLSRILSNAAASISPLA